LQLLKNEAFPLVPDDWRRPLLLQIEKQIKQSGLPASSTVGPRPYDEVIEQFSQADVVVLATAPTASGKHEGIPNVLKEAMACGVPVVATASGGIPELVDESCGILVRPRDPATIADALRLLYDQPVLRRRMGIAGREKIVREFNLNLSTAMRAELFYRSADGCRSHQGLADARQTEPALVTQRPA
jgi:glycosyltransferase involved in cell wall biosynthesis